MNRTNNVLTVVLLMITIVSLMFGFWGVVQISRSNSPEYELHKGIPEPEGFSSFAGFSHHWFWPAGIGHFLGFVFFIVCFLGCMMRWFGGFGFWRGPYPNRARYYRWWRDCWCEDDYCHERRRHRENKEKGE